MSIFRSLIQYFSNAGNILSVNMIYGKIGMATILGLPLPVWTFLHRGWNPYVLSGKDQDGSIHLRHSSNEQSQVFGHKGKDCEIDSIHNHWSDGRTCCLVWTSRLNCINPSDCTDMRWMRLPRCHRER